MWGGDQTHKNRDYGTAEQEGGDCRGGQENISKSGSHISACSVNERDEGEEGELGPSRAPYSHLRRCCGNIDSSKVAEKWGSV